MLIISPILHLKILFFLHERTMSYFFVYCQKNILIANMYIDKANPCVCLSSTLFIMLNSFALCSSLKQLNLSVSLKVNEIKIGNKKHFLILVDLIQKVQYFVLFTQGFNYYFTQSHNELQFRFCMIPFLDHAVIAN